MFPKVLIKMSDAIFSTLSSPCFEKNLDIVSHGKHCCPRRKTIKMATKVAERREGVQNGVLPAFEDSFSCRTLMTSLQVSIFVSCRTRLRFLCGICCWMLRAQGTVTPFSSRFFLHLRTHPEGIKLFAMFLVADLFS